MEETNSDTRQYSRIQLGNAHKLQFSLFDEVSHQLSAYCICTDISEFGAHFFTDRPYDLDQALRLNIHQNDALIESLPVSVIRADSALNDEERYCAAVKFNCALRSLALILPKHTVKNSIAA